MYLQSTDLQEIFISEKKYSKYALSLFFSLGISSEEELSHLSVRKLLSIPKLRKLTIDEIIRNGYSFNKLEVFKINNLYGLDLSFHYLYPSNLLKKRLIRMGVETLRDFLLLDEFKLPKDSIEYYTLFDQVIDAGGLDPKHKNLVEIINESIQASSSKELYRKALSLRISGELTLEEAGKIAKVTRERIRQLEKKCYERIQMAMPVFEKEIKPLLMEREDPLYLWKLEAEIPWLKGLTEFLFSYQHNHFFKNSKKAIKNSSYDVEMFNNQFLFYPYGSPDFLTLSKEIFNLKLEEETEVDLYCKSRKRSDLSLLMIEDNKKRQSNLSLRQKLHRKVLRYLIQADNLKSSDEIFQHCSNEFPQVKLNQILDAITVSGAYKFSARGWGLEEKFGKLTEYEANKIFHLALGFIKTSNTQVSTKDVLLHIKSSSLAYLVRKKNINNYDVDCILRKFNDDDSDLYNKGRLKWSYGKDIGAKKQRKETVKTALEVLSKNGKPMELSQLKKAVQDIVGSINNFQLHTTSTMPDLINIGFDPPMWGLRHRDIAITEVQENNLLKLIKAEFSKDNYILDDKQIMSLCKKVEIIDEITPFQISRFLRRHVYVHAKKSKLFYIKTYSKYPHAFQIIFVDHKGDIPSLNLDEYQIKKLIVEADYISLKEALNLFKINKIFNQSQFRKWRKENPEERVKLPQFPEEYWEDDAFTWL